ncbi:Protein M3 [Mortierella polycephala]|uniref:Protein M3 n=1 Tax=Mortierella polycephala TaxID=41804 RepID=A0A9P6PZJ6_9FUNG|nr:Protein M3 [Mortierella polycephala]
MAKHGLLSPAGAKVVAGMILNYTLPALLFAKMLSCVNQENIEELGFVALVAVFYIIMGAFFGYLIQRTGLVPKRLHWGIVAATMFTNFGDLPISIILAVSDHPPFMIGDGARGTAYSSVFISVFYLFLFPLGGYRLIRYDHIKESKRLQNLTTALQQHEADAATGTSPAGCPPSANEAALSGDTLTSHPDRNQQQKQGQLNHLSSLGGKVFTAGNTARQDSVGMQSSFSATSTMISLGESMEEAGKELRYRPTDHSQQLEQRQHPLEQKPSGVLSATSPTRETNPFIRGNNENNYSNSSSTQASPSHNGHSCQSSPLYPLQILKTPEMPRYSIESIVNNDRDATQVSAGDRDDDNHLIHSGSKTAAVVAVGTSGKKSSRSPLYKAYQPPPLVHQPTTSSNFSSSAASSRPNSPSPYISLTPPGFTNGGRDHGTSSAPGSRRGSVKTIPDSPDTMATVSLEPSPKGPLSTATSLSTSAPSSAMNPTPIPKVPPHLENSYKVNNTAQVHWFWRIFHSTREYLTPPTIGLLLGLLVALTPLRKLFVPTDDPLPSPDDLPPLSFIHEITIMLGGCCVPLGLTVLGASLSRLKPGRMRPLIPALTMITVAKMVISPLIGIFVVQLMLVKRYGWVSGQNHMLQFTLMLMSGSPTSITCFVLAQVWDRRTKNAGGEMAALIAVQYAVATVLLTIGCAFMMYFLF